MVPTLPILTLQPSKAPGKQFTAVTNHLSKYFYQLGKKETSALEETPLLQRQMKTKRLDDDYVLGGTCGFCNTLTRNQKT